MTAHNLLEKTRELLVKRPRDMSYADIAKAINVPERWLEYFAGKDDAAEKALRVIDLYEYLSGKPIDLG